MSRNTFYLSCLYTQPMVRLRSRRSRRALDRIEAAHVAGVRIAALGEIARVTRHSRESGIEKIGVERNDHVRGVELVSGLNRLAEGHLRARVNIVAIDRLIEMPLGLRKFLEQLLLLVGQSWRRKVLRQNAQPRALLSLLRIQRILQRPNQLAPAGDVAEIGNVLRAVRIVQIENRGLRVNIGSTLARRDGGRCLRS